MVRGCLLKGRPAFFGVFKHLVVWKPNYSTCKCFENSSINISKKVGSVYLTAYKASLFTPKFSKNWLPFACSPYDPDHISDPPGSDFGPPRDSTHWLGFPHYSVKRMGIIKFLKQRKQIIMQSYDKAKKKRILHSYCLLIHVTVGIAISLFKTTDLHFSPIVLWLNGSPSGKSTMDNCLERKIEKINLNNLVLISK